MKVPTPRIDALFQASIRELEQKGVAPTPSEAVWLHALCCECVRPDRLDVCEWLPPAVTLGKLNLWPLTIQAQVWLSEYASKWFIPGGDLDALSVAYAMAHGREPGHFTDLTDRPAAKAAVERWISRLPHTIGQVREAVTRWLGDGSAVEIASENEPAEAPDALDWGPVLAPLAFHYGMSPAEVMALPAGMVGDLLENLPDRGGRQAHQALKPLEALRLAKARIAAGHLKEANRGQ